MIKLLYTLVVIVAIIVGIFVFLRQSSDEPKGLKFGDIALEENVMKRVDPSDLEKAKSELMKS